MQPVVVGSHHASKPTIAMRRVAHGTHAGSSFLSSGNHRHHDARGAPIEATRDLFWMRRTDPDDGCGMADHLDLRKHRRLRAAAMLEIDEQPVKSAQVREFGNDGGTGLEPGAELEACVAS